ncbi:3'-5' exonuclease [Linum perenne]
MSINNVRVINFSGSNIEATVTDKASIVDTWVRSVRTGQKLIVGLDCEWRPNTTIFMNNKVALLQLCVGTKCLILQLFYLDYIPRSLKSFLRDTKHTFVGVEVARDVSKLNDDYGLECSKVVDVREMSMERWPNMFWRKPGLKDVAREVAGLRMPKPMDVCRSDWQKRVLDEKQIEYACIDAFASSRIAHALRI